ncbi:MAG: oligopeptidase A [Pseudomonadales bacterium]|nr:oligopeptidase A [Pseudomonadales bacterium]
MKNPLLEQHELPPFDVIKPEHIVPAIDQILADNREAVSRLLSAGAMGYEDLVVELEALDDALNQAFSPVSHMNSVVNSAELRDAYNACLPKISEYATEMGQNPRLYSAYQAIQTSEEFGKLDQAQRMVIEQAIRDFKMSGVNLPKQEQQRFSEISKRLSELSSKFSDNVLDSTMAWSRQFDDSSELQGLPETALELASQTAKQRGEKGYVFTLEFPSYLPVMTYCENESFRKEIYEAYVTRASDQGPNAGEWNNTPVMQEILLLRKEKSELLGFSNYAEYSIAKKMAQSTDQVITFLEDLASKSVSVATAQFEELCEFARQRYGKSELQAWDVTFYSEKLKEQTFDISEEALRPYFPASSVLDGMYEVVRRLYDIDVVPATDVVTWHVDVQTFDIKKDGQRVARFYLDLFARPNKQGGAWMDECRVRRKVKAAGEEVASIQLPVAYLTCNFTGPVGDAPALLTHDQVVTLFHEFGHGLHHMLTKVSAAGVSGINGVAWDAVELPSQFMENWCWQREALGFISGHYESGEVLPEEMLAKMLAGKNFQSAMSMVRQLEFSLFDFRLHAEFDPSVPNQIQAVLDSVRRKLSVVPAPEFNRFQHGFGHIFGGGYAAGYYSYKWAEVLSADAFSRFEQDGIFNRQTGEQFLVSVLEQGGSIDPMDMFVSFMGREPRVEALLKQDGIVA